VRLRGDRPWYAAGVLAVLLAACAPKVVAPPPPGPEKFPDFVFPAAADNMAAPEILDRQHLAWQFLQAGDTHNADRTFNGILKDAPGFYPAEAGLGYSALARKDAGAAIDHFDRALTANGNYAPALAGKGDALLSQNHADAALQTFEKALTVDPTLASLKARVDVLKFRTVQQDIAEARKAADEGKLADAQKAYEASIAASPESAFLYRELAAVERRQGNTQGALVHAEQAATLDPSDARALVMVGEIHEANREWSKAADAYAAANALEPGDALAARVDAMRQRAAFDSMPEEYRTIEQAPTITRAQLAALLGVRLEDLLRRARGATAPVITDTRGSWAAPWILAVTRAGAMDVYANHTFQPDAVVRRQDLAQVVSRVLTLIANDQPKLAARWRDARPRFSDLPPTHLSYEAAARAVSAGVMAPVGGDTFQLTRPVSGAEAVAAVGKLEALARGR
jgi:tetratricopeptide (TPR) repeat protein